MLSLMSYWFSSVLYSTDLVTFSGSSSENWFFFPEDGSSATLSRKGYGSFMMESESAEKTPDKNFPAGAIRGLAAKTQESKNATSTAVKIFFAAKMEIFRLLKFTLRRVALSEIGFRNGWTKKSKRLKRKVFFLFHLRKPGW